MKKLILSCLTAVVAALPMMGQTEFRHITFDEAKAAAKAEGKQIFIDFFTTWCGPCKRLAANVFPTKSVGDYLNGNFVCLKIDAEKGEGVELAKKFGVRAYPTLAVVDANGELVGSFSGLKEGDEFIASVEMCKNLELSPEKVAARYESGERNLPLVLAYTSNLRDNARSQEDLDRAVAILDEYFTTLSDEDRLNKENIGLFTTSAWTLRNPRVRYLVDNRSKFGSEHGEQLDKIIHDAYLEGALRYLTSNDLKDNAEKLASYNQFKKEVADHGYTDEFATFFEFADKRRDSDDATYLAFCDKNFERLDDMGQGQFSSYITNIFPAETDDQRKALSNFLRNHISKMSANTLYWTATVILSLENRH
ncbi:MAG: thioredoxin family protein [Bacteroides sp.]|nr:thioredoxin family protein [Bacteroides sp.]